MDKNRQAAPFLKWVGGKRQLIPAITNVLPADIGRYTWYEPFIGGGAMLFHLQPQRAVINDFNHELINVYEVIRNHPEELIEDLRKHRNEPDYFYEMRALDKNGGLNQLSSVQRASRVIFLNKTCYNGLYRVNKAGEFNTPFGRYKNPNIINEEVLRAVSDYLNTAEIEIHNTDYTKVAELAGKDAFVYLDPPYHPISASSSFTGYVQGGWNGEEQVRLRETCDRLNKKGIRFLQSNSSSPFIKELYKDYTITTVKASRYINSVAAKRGAIDEVLIRNY